MTPSNPKRNTILPFSFCLSQGLSGSTRGTRFGFHVPRNSTPGREGDTGTNTTLPPKRPDDRYTLRRDDRGHWRGGTSSLWTGIGGQGRGYVLCYGPPRRHPRASDFDTRSTRATTPWTLTAPLTTSSYRAGCCSCRPTRRTGSETSRFRRTRVRSGRSSHGSSPSRPYH